MTELLASGEAEKDAYHPPASPPLPTRDRTCWHLITKGAGPWQLRTLDLRRRTVLPRVRDLLKRLASDDPRACYWHERRRSLVVAPVDFSLKVVLFETAGTFILGRTYTVTKRRKRTKLMNRAAIALGARWSCASLPTHSASVSSRRPLEHRQPGRVTVTLLCAVTAAYAIPAARLGRDGVMVTRRAAASA